MKSKVLPLCLFGDNAPRLRHFSGCTIPCKFSSNASWIPNLTSATFSRTFTPEEVLTALQRMPRLVSVVVHTNSNYKTFHWQGAQVALPKLRMLEVQGGIRRACALLECITPSPGCCLSIHDAAYHSLAGGFENHIQYEQYENAIKPYILSYFSLHPLSSVEFRLLKNQLDLALDPDEWGRRFHVVIDISFLSSSLLMKELMSSTSLSHIRTFNLQLLDNDSFASYFQTNIAVITTLEAFCPSVTTLRTNEHTLRQLLKCPLSITSSLFPALVTLQFTGPSMTWPGDEPTHQTFLNLRKSMGRPFDFVTLSEPEDASVFSGCLKHHTGFLVKLGDR
ncbi:hypothetical protein CPC08DRAFT_709502 [Agrocybe pediades]|nr:hypothetical protein CPC08DRAFT_709502 [Agrocybe pediades]